MFCYPIFYSSMNIQYTSVSASKAAVSVFLNQIQLLLCTF